MRCFVLLCLLAGCTIGGDSPAPPWTPHADCTGALTIAAVHPWPGGGLQIVTASPVDGAYLAGMSLATAPVDGPGLTAIVVHDAATARAQLEALPADERVALIGDDQLLADLTTDRAHLGARLDAFAGGTTSQPVIDQLTGALGAVSGPDRRTLLGATATRTTGLVPVSGPTLTRIGACGPAVPTDTPLTLVTSTGQCTFGAPPPMTDRAGEACDPVAAAADAFPYPADLAITMTAEQRRAWDEAQAASDERELGFAITLGGTPVAARGHFRGASSLGCERKSLNVDLDGPEARRLAPGLASDELLLISLCLDDGYFRQALGEVVMGPLFPLPRRFVRLSVDGQSRGVYWLLAKPTASLVDQSLATRAVIRRRFDPDGTPPDVEYGDGLAAYQALTLDPARMDVDGYLTWLALASLLHNGDYVDELFFAGAAEAGGLWFHLLGWDPDDLGSACHHEGMWAIADRCQLTYCAEGNLDHELLGDAALYDRYRAVLTQVLADWPQERLSAAALSVQDALFAAMSTDATCAAMIELGAPDCATAHALIAQKIHDYLDLVAARRAELTSRLELCP